MKLVFVKKHFNPYGGAELYLLKVINLLKNSFSISVVSGSWEKISGINFYEVPKCYLPLGKEICFALKSKRVIEKLNKKGAIVFSFERGLYQDIYRASDGCHLRWLENRKRYLSSKLKSFSFAINPKHLEIKWLEKKCLEVSKVVITNSFMVKKDFEVFYGKKVSEKCKVIYNGVDTKKFFPLSVEEKLRLRVQMGLKKSAKILLFVGSGYARKGLEFLLKTLQILKKEVLLLVIGKEKKENFYKSLAKSLKVEDKVVFLGAKKDIVKFYQISDIFVLPTIYDPFSNACLEALACGLPVITTSANGASELIKDGKNGFVISLPIEIEDLKFKVEHTFNNLENMRKFALNTAKKFPLELAISRLQEVIKSAYFRYKT